MTFSREMMAALEADGEKLRQLTGEDHGPVFWITCESCGGEGSIEIHRPQHDDPYFAVVHKCECCNGTGFIESDNPQQIDMEDLE